MRNILARKYIVALLLMLPIVETSSSVVGSKHDLSTSNFYSRSSGASEQICIFCHTPHSANADLIEPNGQKAPMWNRKITDMGAFVLYGESPGSPGSISLACLSCHDGVSSKGRASAVGVRDVHMVINAAGVGLSGPNGAEDPSCSACHPFAQPDGGGMYPSVAWQIGADLTDDHPITVDYAVSLAHYPTEFLSEPINGLKLFNGKVECASCHDVHNNDHGLFLRTSNAGSQLCASCHIK